MRLKIAGSHLERSGVSSHDPAVDEPADSSDLLPAVDSEGARRCAAMTHDTGVIAMSHVQFSNGFRSTGNPGRIKGHHALVINAAQSAVLSPSM